MIDLHSRMVSAVLAGEGLRGIVELAAAEVGGPVAIVLPGRGLAAASDDEVGLAELSTRAGERLHGPPGLDLDAVAEHAVETGSERIGYVVALRTSSNGRPPLDVPEVLRTAALATVTEVAVTDARDEVVTELRGTLLDELRSDTIDPAELLRRAARLGCDLAGGGVALVAEIRSSTPQGAAALVRADHPSALAEVLPTRPRAGGEGSSGAAHPRVYAVLPADAEGSQQRTLASARALAKRLRPHGPAVFSSSYADPAQLARAVSEAEVALEVVAADERLAEQVADGMADGVYRLLFRALATDPEEVRRFYRETVEPLVEHDRQYRTELLATLEAYLVHDCNMNATARAAFAHRHTIAHRLARVRELTGLDPATGEERERLGLGIKAYRILAPTLPR
jgi:PucR C-terminal helix-turn-helix domain/GGDEF-like domain